MKRIFSIIMSLIAPVVMFGQSEMTYRPPMDIPLELSANYGEVRTNRFHTGVDLRTQQREGIPVKAIADGYVSRLGVIPAGYGNVLYIAHPNGTTSVYGHLQRFAPKLAAFAYNERYRLKTIRLDSYLTADKFPVKAGEIIGYSGNTGMSFGPHLHFELRSSRDQSTLEPTTKCGLTIPDTTPPTIANLYYVAVDTVGGVAVTGKPANIPITKLSSGEYNVSGAVSVAPSGYFVVQTIDPKTGGSTNMSARRVEQRVDGKLTFVINVDGLTFDKSKYASSMTYYPMQKGSKYDYFRLAKQKGNLLPVYSNVINNGLIRAEIGETKDIKISVTDDCRLTSELQLKIVGVDNFTNTPSTAVDNGKLVRVNAITTAGSDGATVRFPAWSLADDIIYTQSVSGVIAQPKDGVVVLSEIYTLHNEDTPICKPLTLSINATVPTELQKHTMLAKVSSTGGVGYAGGKYSNGTVSGSIYTFGNYCVVADTIPPTIESSVGDGTKFIKTNHIWFKVKDSFSGTTGARASIDGKWVLLEHNAVKGVYTHYFDNDRIPLDGKRHEITFEIQDNCNNKTVRKIWYIR